MSNAAKVMAEQLIKAFFEGGNVNNDNTNHLELAKKMDAIIAVAAQIARE